MKRLGPWEVEFFNISNKCEMAGQAPSCQHPGRISPLAAWILVVEEWAKWIYVI